MTPVDSAGTNPDHAAQVMERHGAALAAADAARRQGDLTGALAQYRAARNLVRPLLDATPGEPGALAAMALNRRKTGDVLVALGDLAAALDALRDEMELRRRLAAAEPQNAEARENVARTAARIAEILVLKSAIATFPGNAASASGTRPKDASWALTSVGGTLQAQGNITGALALYRESLSIRRKLAADQPDNAGWQLDVSWSLAGLAGALASCGDLSGALAHHAEALAIRRTLAARVPGDPQRQLDVAWSLAAMGDVLEAKGDLAGALTAFRNSLEIRRALSAAEPGNAGLRCDMSVSLSKIAGVLEASGDRAGALVAYREARDGVRELSVNAPDRPEWRDDLSALDDRIAELTQSR